MNPDGRFNGQRANENGFDMNRDWLVQSQPEVRANLRLQVEWLAPVMFATHGYVNPTLVDGLTKPHNPGLEYDVFAYWNQRRAGREPEGPRPNRAGHHPAGQWPAGVHRRQEDRHRDRDLRRHHGDDHDRIRPRRPGRCDDRRRWCRARRTYDGTFTGPDQDEHDRHLHDAGAGLPASTGGTLTGPNTVVNRGNCSNGDTPGPASNICGTLTIAAAPGGLTQSGTTVTVTTTTASTVFPPHVADTILISGSTDGLQRRAVPRHVDHLADPVHL